MSPAIHKGRVALVVTLESSKSLTTKYPLLEGIFYSRDAMSYKFLAK